MDKPAYHHGDLKSALISAALAAVEQNGPDAVSLRDLAQSLGVSRAAPYRHFADRDALLAAVAAKGFEELCVVYETALAGPGDGRQRMRQSLVDYLEFARRRPGLRGRRPLPALRRPRSRSAGARPSAALPRRSARVRPTARRRSAVRRAATSR